MDCGLCGSESNAASNDVVEAADRGSSYAVVEGIRGETKMIIRWIYDAGLDCNNATLNALKLYL